MTLQELNRKYIYKTDKDNFGWIEHWQVMEEVDGKYEGDCDSYCLTLQKKVEGFKDVTLWYCTIRGVGHCVAELPDGKYIDCNFKRPVSIADMIVGGYANFREYWRIVIWFKMVQAKVQRWIGL